MLPLTHYNGKTKEGAAGTEECGLLEVNEFSEQGGIMLSDSYLICEDN